MFSGRSTSASAAEELSGPGATNCPARFSRCATFQARSMRELIAHISDRTCRMLDASRHTFVAGRPHGITRPVDGCRRSVLRAPGVTDGVEVFGERECGTAAVLPNDSRNREVRKRHTRIRFRDERMVPVRDLPEEDPDIGLPG